MGNVAKGAGTAIVWTVIFDYRFDHRRFDVPLGGLLEYAGIGKWPYRRPETNQVSTFVDCAPNVSARDSGGMKGTVWKVVSIEKESSDKYRVTLDPVDSPS
jgi:hypothetical protein